MHKSPGLISENAVVSLKEVTKASLKSILDLTVRKDQERFLASNAVSIAQAYFDRDEAWFRGIYADETPVGFLVLFCEKEIKKYYLCRFMIDEKFQGFGYGAAALLLLFEYLKVELVASELMLFHHQGDGNPGKFYEKMGFIYTGKFDDDEIGMCKMID